jgi:hypothetical protein
MWYVMADEQRMEHGNQKIVFTQPTARTTISFVISSDSRATLYLINCVVPEDTMLIYLCNDLNS